MLLSQGAGAIPAAAAAIQERAKLSAESGPELYAAARDLAKCIPLVGKDQGSLTPEEEAERNAYAEQAVQLLQQAIAKGFKDLSRLSKDTALAPLRDREDFQKLLPPGNPSPPGAGPRNE
jgi:hypothetical protein